MNEFTEQNFLKGMKIAVLMGGWSSEDLKSEEDADKRIKNIDIAFIALHGKGGEDGFIQDLLKRRGIKFTGSDAEACRISMNKAETKKIWRDLSLPTPDFVEIKKVDTLCFWRK